MANLKRLTRRVEEMENWIDENGDGDTMANMHYLIRSVRQAGDMLQNEQRNTQNLRGLLFGFLKEKNMEKEWDEFLKETEENAVQEQQAEKIPVQEQTEDSEEVIEEEE
tara:strand:+ start:496 stop:822 length:327 start_codon:yes stop_codon:yes gene_type:complete